MVSLIVYLVITVFLGLVISFVLVTMRSTKKRGDSAPYFTIFFCLVLTIGGPFAYTEAVTAMYGKDMEHAIKQAYNDAPIRGDLQYYRVIWVMGDHAKAFAIGEEHATWGGTDKPILGVDLKRQKMKWVVDPPSHLLYSDRLNKDSIIFPPYR